MEVCSDFIQGDPRKAWDGLKKLTGSFSSSSSSTINSSSSNVLKDRNGKLLCTPQDLVDRFGEHYEALASDKNIIMVPPCLDNFNCLNFQI